jgi:pyruvate dehydrogenase E1 component alpha subunit
MVQTRAMDLRRKPTPATMREALLAATTMQLQAGDLLCGEADDPVTAKLAPATKEGLGELVLPSAMTAKAGSRLALCAATARGLQGPGTAKESALLLAFARAGVAEAGWPESLGWAQEAGLPLLLAVTDATGGRPVRQAKSMAGAMDWASISAFSRRSKLPVITVDGEDAVAVYRVMQECVLRTRMGSGPAVIWAVMSSGAEAVARGHQPIARLRSYMKARGIALG